MKNSSENEEVAAATAAKAGDSDGTCEVCDEAEAGSSTNKTQTESEVEVVTVEGNEQAMASQIEEEEVDDDEEEGVDNTNVNVEADHEDAACFATKGRISGDKFLAPSAGAALIASMEEDQEIKYSFIGPEEEETGSNINSINSYDVEHALGTRNLTTHNNLAKKKTGVSLGTETLSAILRDKCESKTDSDVDAQANSAMQQQGPGAYAMPGIQDRERMGTVALSETHTSVAPNIGGDENENNQGLMTTASTQALSALTQAILVQELPQATPQPPRSQKRNGLEASEERTFTFKHLCSLLAILLVLAAVMVVVFAAVAGKNGTNPASDDMRSNFSSFFLRRLVTEQYGVDYFNDTRTESSKAKQVAVSWMLSEDPLQLIQMATREVQLEAPDSYNFVPGPTKKRILQRYALVAFYFHTNGSETGWTSCSPPTKESKSDFCYHESKEQSHASYGARWLTGVHECQWYGIACLLGKTTWARERENDVNDISRNESVTTVNLEGFNLFGSIPSELQALSDLHVMNLQNNILTGNLPLFLSQFQSLLSCTLSANMLRGTIPDCIFSAPSFLLSLGQNSFTGTVPSSIGRFSGRFLGLAFNQLTGTIPRELYSLTNLAHLMLNDNMLIGSVLPSVGQLQNLRSLLINDNQLSASIPNTIANMSNIESLVLSRNLLHGTLPAKVYKLSKLESFSVAQNTLSGALPTDIGYATKLTHLELQHNDFEGSLPTELKRLTALRILQVEGNARLTGTIPLELCSGMKSSDSVMVANCWAGSDKVSAPISCQCCTTCCDSESSNCIPQA